tara:strand:- start:626 stop:832 length:207 start_codon:yes stop_codon:yes gene_type:complete
LEKKHTIVEQTGSVDRMIFDNAKQLNAIFHSMWQEAARILETFSANDLIHASIVTGKEQNPNISTHAV